METGFRTDKAKRRLEEMYLHRFSLQTLPAELKPIFMLLLTPVVQNDQLDVITLSNLDKHISK